MSLPPRGSHSEESTVQEERERTALVVLYSSPAQIPDTPTEPPTQIPEEQVDEGAKALLTGPDVDAIFWSDGGEPALVDTVRPTASVAELVGQLQADRPDVVMGDPSQAAAAMPSLYPGLGSINPDQLQQLVQHARALTQGGAFGSLGALGSPPPPPTGPAHGGDSGWGPGPANGFSEYDRGYHENGVGRGAGPGPGPGDPNRRWGDDGWGGGAGPSGGGGGGGGGERGGPPFSRGRGGRGMRGMGRGRGDGHRSTKRKPCTFFQAGRRAHIQTPRGPAQ